MAALAADLGVRRITEVPAHDSRHCVTTWLASLVAGLLGAVAGFALNRASLGPAAKDALAFGAGAACGLALVITRSVVFFVNATREHGIAAVGFDPRGSLLLMFGALVLSAVVMHFALGRVGAGILLSPVAIGGFTGLAVCWTLWRGYWSAG
jgi:hypothetical protein